MAASKAAHLVQQMADCWASYSVAYSGALKAVHWVASLGGSRAALKDSWRSEQTVFQKAVSMVASREPQMAVKWVLHSADSMVSRMAAYWAASMDAMRAGSSEPSKVDYLAVSSEAQKADCWD
jgi:hypothetical protein